MEHSFRLGFWTESGAKAFIRVPFADTETTDAAVKNAMARIVNTGVVRTSAGPLASPASASLVSVETVLLEV